MIQILNDNKELVIMICNVISITIAIIVFILNLQKSKRERKLANDRELFNLVIKPIFNMIEPIMFKQLSMKEYYELFNSALRIAKKNTPISYEEVNYIERRIEHLSKDYKKKQKRPIYYFCNYFGFKYKTISKKLNYPVRSLEYKKRHKQFSSSINMKVQQIWWIIKQCFFTIMKGLLAAVIEAIIIAVILVIYLTINPQ